MLLSIDRILLLLSEGKSIEKIADLSNADVKDIYGIIEEARQLLLTHNKTKTKKKVILKKRINTHQVDSEEDLFKTDKKTETAIFDGAELSAVPYESSLLIYTDGASKGNPGPSGIGIVIFDKDDREVGKLSHYLGIGTNNYAEYSALIRALKIAIYFKTKDLKVRTDSELIVKQIKGEYRVSSDNIKPLYDEVISLKKKINSFRIEYVPRTLNDKADHLAKKAVSTIDNKKN